MLCSQCNAPAERCTRCAAALCTRRLCAELHEASCEAVSALPVGAPDAAPLPAPIIFKSRARPRRERDTEAERVVADHLVMQITRHRQSGRAALLTGDLDMAFDELWAARHLDTALD